MCLGGSGFGRDGESSDVTRRKGPRVLSVIVTVACVAGCLWYVAEFKWLPTWRFERYVSDGLTQEEVVKAVGSDYDLYTPDRYDQLRAVLRDYYPEVDFSGAAHVMVYKVGRPDPLGLVLLSKEGVVIKRVVVQT